MPAFVSVWFICDDVLKIGCEQRAERLVFLQPYAGNYVVEKTALPPDWYRGPWHEFDYRSKRPNAPEGCDLGQPQLRCPDCREIESKRIAERDQP